ncbi:hypothetical protein RCL1_006769 [Eukaryota sp. TZLM3-RCL]
MESPFPPLGGSAKTSTPKKTMKPMVLTHLHRTPPHPTERTEVAHTDEFRYPLFRTELAEREEIPPARTYLDFDGSAVPAPSFSSHIEDSKSWVTLFGFQPEQISSVLNYLSRVGVVLERSPGNGNYLHVRFSDPVQAAAALTLNGTSFQPGSLLGVAPLLEVPRGQTMELSSVGMKPVNPASSVLVPESEQIFLKPKRKASILTKFSELFFG